MLTKCVWLITTILIFSAWLAGADAPTIGLPILGYSVRQFPPELRPMRGVPGAAVIGEQMLLPPRTTRLHVAPGQQYAIIERAEESPAVLMIEDTAHSAIIPISGVMQAPEAVWFSPSGGSAALAARTSGRVQIIGGLPLAPEVVRDIDVRSFQSFPNSIAVNDSGSSVLYATPGAVYSLLPDGSSQMILSVAGEASIAFLPGSAAAAIGDPGSGVVSLFKGLPGGPAVLAGGLAGLHHLAASRDGRLLFVASRDAPLVWAINLATGAVNVSQLQVIPQRLDPLRSADTFLISSKAGEPDWIVFRRADGLGAVFIPGASRDPLPGKQMIKPVFPRR